MVAKLPNPAGETLVCRNPIIWKFEGQSNVEAAGWRYDSLEIAVCWCRGGLARLTLSGCEDQDIRALSENNLLELR